MVKQFYNSIWVHHMGSFWRPVVLGLQWVGSGFGSVKWPGGVCSEIAEMPRVLRDNLLHKPYSYNGYFIREYHFHFLGLGISGWEYGFSMEVLVHGVKVGFFL